MDSEPSAGYERHFDDLKYSARVWSNFYRQKPERLFNGLLVLLYVLILALFITVFSRSKSGNAQLVSKKETTDFQSKVSSLSSEMEQLAAEFKSQTCVSGWIMFQSSCYYMGGEKMDWQAARAFCQSKDSDLVVINSQKEQVFLTGKINPSRYNRYWIGLHDFHEEGVWKWVDGTNYTTSVTFWSQGEPNDIDDEDCVHMWFDGEWNDVPCTYDRCYTLCEKTM